MTDYSPIPTRYNGYTFRSRLEARYAVLFDELKIKYEYEKEGYEYEGTRYLPDFWLPFQQIWIEVKGTTLTELDTKKVIELCRFSKRNVLVFVGDIGQIDHNRHTPHSLYQFAYVHPEDAERMKENPGYYGDSESVLKAVERGFGVKACENAPLYAVCHALEFDSYYIDKAIQAMRSARFEFGQEGLR
jgi:hypothetical protein